MTRIAPHTRDAARQLRAAMTPQDRRVWQHLRDLNRTLGTHFRRQAPVGPHIADFADLGRAIVIEIDGSQHASRDVLDRDCARDAWFAARGYAVLRFWNSDVNTNIDGVMQVILDAVLGAAPPPPPSPTRGEGASATASAGPRHGASAPLPPRGGGRGWGGCASAEPDRTP